LIRQSEKTAGVFMKKIPVIPSCGSLPPDIVRGLFSGQTLISAVFCDIIIMT